MRYSPIRDFFPGREAPSSNGNREKRDEGCFDQSSVRQRLYMGVDTITRKFLYFFCFYVKCASKVCDCVYEMQDVNGCEYCCPTC